MTKDTGQATTTTVQVALRIRPLTERDRAQPRFANLANDDVLKLHNKTVQVVPQNKLFTFDHVFGTTSSQEEIFTAIGDNLIRKFIEGYNVTILAYGQTSSGKTYTMGTAAHGSVINPTNEGIVPRSMALLFDLLHNVDSSTRPISPTSSISSSTTTSNKSASRLRPKSRIANRSSHIPHVNNSNSHKTKYTIKVSFIEIYNEELHDLLNSAPPEELPPINIREDTKGRIYWTGVKEVLVHSTDDVLYYLEQGTQNRATGATDMNEKSSRSHAIFSVALKQEKWVPSDTPKKPTRPASALSTRSPSRLGKDEDGEWLITTSKFHFVDLAGSERLKRTAAEGDRRKEGININAGLLALGNVISALGDPSKKNVHVPYRDSKLTRLLQDSLGGSATTLMIACVSPVEYNLAETLNTLQYANRARNIKNKSEKNQVEEWMTTENIELLRSLIGKLKNELSYLKTHHKSLPPPPATNDDLFDDSSTISSSTPSMDELYQEQRSLIADLQRQVEELDGEAAVTRERNKMVEKELQRLRLLESMAQTKQEQVDFQHLVEPVIEEYEKSVAKLESQLAMTRAALNHSDIGVEEQQNKVLQLESVVRAQEQSISELRSRLSKILEREQSNEAYIQELESKLMKSAQDASRDQEMLNELKNRIMKLKETDENTEQYISNLEQRLAAADTERARLLGLVEELEAKVEARERKHMEMLKKYSKQATDTSTTEKLILKELDEVNVKYSELAKERDTLQLQIEQLQKETKRQSITPAPEEAEPLEEELEKRRLSISSSGSASKKFKNNRKSFADENETASSVAALTLLQTETRLKEETNRANHLQMTLDRLQYDHEETAKELDEVLQRYHETLEQLDFLERTATPATEEEPLSKSLDLNKEIAQAKQNQEKQEYMNQIEELTHKVQSLNKKIAIKDSELEMANDSIKKLQEELEKQHVENNVDAKPAVDEELKKALAQEKEQSSHWRQAHRGLKEDMDKMVLDLDEKEQYITQLKNKLDGNDEDSHLQEEVVSLQKRLAETLGSLTVLKIAHDGLQKKLQQERDGNQLASVPAVDAELAKFNNERQVLLEKHKEELDHVQSEMESKLTAINQTLDATTSDKEAAFERLAKLEAELKAQVEESQNKHFLEQERLLEEHNAELLELTQSFESTCKDLKSQISKLQKEIDNSNLFHEDLIKEHENQLKDLHAGFDRDSQELLDKISQLEQEVATSKALHAQVVAEHEAEIIELSNNFERATHELEEQIFKLESELEASKDLHEEILASHSERIRDTRQEEQQRALEVEQNLKQQLDALQSELHGLKTSQQGILDKHAGHLESVNAEHESSNQRLEKEIEELKNSLALAETSHSDAVSQLTTDHEQVVEQHRQQLELLQSQLKDTETTYSEKIAMINSENDTIQQQLKDRISKLESQIQETQINGKATIAQHIDELKSQHEQQLDALQSQLKDTEATHVDKLAKINDENGQAQQQLQSRIDELVLELSNVDTKSATDSNSQFEELQLQHKQQLDLLQSQLKEMETLHAENLQKVIDANDKAQQQLKNRIEELVSQLNVMETKSTEEIDDGANKPQYIENLESQHKQQLELLQSQLKDAEAAHSANLTKVNDEKDKAQQPLQERINLLESQLKDTENKPPKDTTKEDNLAQQIKDLQSQLKKANADHTAQVSLLNDENIKTIQSLESSYEAKTKQEIESLQLKLKETESQYVESLKKLNLEHEQQLSKQLDDNRVLLEKVQEELEAIKKENAQLKEEKRDLVASRSRAASPTIKTEGVAGRIKLLESQFKGDSPVSPKDSSKSIKSQIDKLQEKLEEEQQKTISLNEKISTLELELSAKEEELVAQHEETLAQIKVQHEKELEIQLESIEQMAQEHEEELAQLKQTSLEAKDQELVDSYETRLGQLKAEHDVFSRQLALEREAENKQMTQVTETLKEELRSKEHQIEQLEKQVVELKELLHHVNEKGNKEPSKAEQRIAELEHQVKQVQEENLEYTALSGELENEITRVTREMESLADDLERSEDKMNEIKSTLGILEEEGIMKKLNELMNERSEMSKKLAEAQAGSGASLGTTYKLGDSNTVNTPNDEKFEKEFAALKKEVSDYQAEASQVHHEKDELEQQYKKDLDEQKQKLEQSERARRKLEKQLEDFLTKKSSFLCF